MSFDGKSLDDYKTVAERIAEFRTKYPDGSLQPADPTEPFTITKIDDKTFITYAAAAYRHAGDERPGIGVAWEPFPGLTPYVKNSELQNAETAAWGRAIVAALAADTRKGIATRDEMRRQDDEFSPPIGGRVLIKAEALSYRDRALSDGATFETARVIYAEIKADKAYLLEVLVPNEAEDDEKLGDLLIRLGVEPK